MLYTDNVLLYLQLICVRVITYYSRNLECLIAT